jgi:ppGpp synthetase/RelA/SpoT-type nucleotidyltranferase
MAAGRPLTKSQVDRLGERLRGSETISAEDLEVLQRLQAVHADALRAVQERIEAILPGISQTGRVKTVGTLHDKLRRQPTKLSRVQDVAGVRIVDEVGLAAQDEMAGALVAEFPGARVVDRRKRPMHGYRAVHVIVEQDGCLVEIQVRTKMQHLWAEIVERLGDRWGRQIRYGELPADPDREIGGEITRRRLWEATLSLSDNIAAAEDAAAALDLAVELGEAPEGTTPTDIADLSRTLHDLLVSMEQVIRSDAGL